VIAQRGELTDDPVLSTLLRLEVAEARERAGDAEGALSILRTAVSTPAARYRVLGALERVARAHDRFPELVVALEGRAKLAAADARGDDQGQASGAFRVQRFQDERRAAQGAAAFYREAAHLRVARLGDLQGALRDLDEALRLRPDEPLLHFDRMLLKELEGDLSGAAEEAKALLDAGIEGPHVRRLALPARRGRAGAGRHRRRHRRPHGRPRRGPDLGGGRLDPRRRLPGLGGGRGLRAPARGARGGRRGSGSRPAPLGGGPASRRPAPGRRPGAAPLRRRGPRAIAADQRTALRREQLGAAHRLGDAEGAIAASRALLSADDVEPAERGALLFELHQLLQGRDATAALEVLAQALEEEGAAAWAADLARLWAARRGEEGATILAAAHRQLAERAAEPETESAHLAAAARALRRAGDVEGAIATLREALTKTPGHAYALALLEELLRSAGEEEEVLELLKQSAGGEAGEAQLLRAAATAEAAGELDEAVRLYEQAAEQYPEAFAPLLALSRVAVGRDDRPLRRRALEGLSALEIASGEPGRHTLALGEHLDLLGDDPAAAVAPLRKALESEQTAMQAAVDLAFLGGGAATTAPRLEGLTHLAEPVEGDLRAVLDREVAGTALIAHTAPEQGEAILARLRELAPGDPWIHLSGLRRADDGGSRADAWLGLGQATEDADVAADLLLHGLRAHAVAREDEALDDAVILAHEVASAAPGGLAAAVALDEVLAAGDDAEERARAYDGQLAQIETLGPERRSIVSAQGRALTAANRPQEALEGAPAGRPPRTPTTWPPGRRSG
jgi:tetratricopeptide (TPR) repeat protein